MPMMLEPAAPRSQIKHSTTEPLPSPPPKKSVSKPIYLIRFYSQATIAPGREKIAPGREKTYVQVSTTGPHQVRAVKYFV